MLPPVGSLNLCLELTTLNSWVEWGWLNVRYARNVRLRCHNGGMAILIDPPVWPAHGMLWGHLVSDVSHAELHDFARAAGLPARAFERDHYDYPADRYDDLVRLGAEPVRATELVRRLIASGLRRRKREYGTPDAG